MLTALVRIGCARLWCPCAPALHWLCARYDEASHACSCSLWPTRLLILQMQQTADSRPTAHLLGARRYAHAKIPSRRWCSDEPLNTLVYNLKPQHALRTQKRRAALALLLAVLVALTQIQMTMNFRLEVLRVRARTAWRLATFSPTAASAARNLVTFLHTLAFGRAAPATRSAATGDWEAL